MGSELWDVFSAPTAARKAGSIIARQLPDDRADDAKTVERMMDGHRGLRALRRGDIMAAVVHLARAGIVCVLLMVMTSCSNTSKSGKWHFSGFNEVRAYRLNWEDEHSMDPIVNQDGSLNPTRIPEDGIRLTEAQVKRLEAAVTGSHPAHPVAACFYPHHAFVFFNGSKEIVGHINICFLCSNYTGQPAGYAVLWNLSELKELIGDIGMPLRNAKWR